MERMSPEAFGALQVGDVVGLERQHGEPKRSTWTTQEKARVVSRTPSTVTVATGDGGSWRVWQNTRLMWLFPWTAEVQARFDWKARMERISNFVSVASRDVEKLPRPVLELLDQAEREWMRIQRGE